MTGKIFTAAFIGVALLTSPIAHAQENTDMAEVFAALAPDDQAWMYLLWLVRIWHVCQWHTRAAAPMEGRRCSPDRGRSVANSHCSHDACRSSVRR